MNNIDKQNIVNNTVRKFTHFIDIQVCLIVFPWNSNNKANKPSHLHVNIPVSKNTDCEMILRYIFTREISYSLLYTYFVYSRVMAMYPFGAIGQFTGPTIQLLKTFVHQAPNIQVKL